nr:ATP-binding cassette domain-containing protein [Rhodophyticola sp. CCM32]
MTLEMCNVTAGYGSRMILNDLSLTVTPGERIALIGHNGAGKSTILKAITGEIRPRKGEVRINGERLDRIAPEHRVRRGVAQVPAGRHVFPQLSVEKNLRVGAYTRSDREGIDADMALYFDKFPVLRQKARRQAGTLSGGSSNNLPSPAP